MEYCICVLCERLCVALGQAVWRKTQNLGLRGSYFQDNATHKIIRRLMALPLLPAEHITHHTQYSPSSAQKPGIIKTVEFLGKCRQITMQYLQNTQK